MCQLIVKGALMLALSAPWAGLTRPQVVPHAIRDVIAEGVALGQLTPAKARLAAQQLEKTRPLYVRKVRCLNGREAWAVRWPKSDPVYLNAKRMLLGCR